MIRTVRTAPLSLPCSTLLYFYVILFLPTSMVVTRIDNALHRVAGGRSHPSPPTSHHSKGWTCIAVSLTPRPRITTNSRVWRGDKAHIYRLLVWCVGCGGLTEGLSMAGIKVTDGVESDTAGIDARSLIRSLTRTTVTIHHQLDEA